MKVRLYCVCPKYVSGNGWNFSAYSAPPGGTIPEGWQVVALDVDMPCKEYDELVPASTVSEVQK